MIVITIEENAGLGNQLFQYSHGYALAKKYNQDIHLVSYIGRADNLRFYMLDQLSLDTTVVKKITRVDRVNFFKGKAFRGSDVLNRMYRKILQNEYKRLSQKGKMEKRIMLKEQYRTYIADAALLPEKDYYLEGFYESYRYFIEFADEIRKQFKVQERYIDSETKKWEQEIGSCNSVAIHIRMGDFVICKRLFPIEFYEAAYQHLRTTLENPVFYVFSEDDSVKDYFAGKNDRNIRIVTLNCKNKDVMEWHLLSKCHHHVLTNSTYSWWSAFAADYPGKRVFIPQMDEYLMRENADIFKGSKKYGEQHYRDYFPKEYEVLPPYGLADGAPSADCRAQI